MSLKKLQIKIYPKRVYAELPHRYNLSEEQLRCYEVNGYLVIKELLDSSSLHAFKQRFTQICNGETQDFSAQIVKDPGLLKRNLKPEEYVNKLQDILYDDVFCRYSEHPRMLDILSQLIGEDITAMHSMFINKPPGTGRHPPHQDLYYFPFRPADKIVGSWTAVDRVTKDNGCLYVLPGSHKDNTLYRHGHLPGAMRMYHGILEEATAAPEDRRLHLEMSPGDTVFFHPMLVHGSGPNITKNYRKAISVHYAASSCEYIDVHGTVQEEIAREVEDFGKGKGLFLDYVDIWKNKCKQVKGVKCNL